MDFCGDLQNRNLFTTELHQGGGEALIKLSISSFKRFKNRKKYHKIGKIDNRCHIQERKEEICVYFSFKPTQTQNELQT